MSLRGCPGRSRELTIVNSPEATPRYGNDVTSPMPQIKPECAQCAVGVACGTRQGQACEFVDERWQRDGVIYRQGSRAEHAWYIKTGSVVLRRAGGESAAGDGRIHSVRFPGGLVGLELLVGDEYIDTAQAGPDTILCRIGRDELDRWLGPAGSPARTTLELMLGSEVAAMARQAGVGRSAPQRLAAWLCREVPRGHELALRRRELADLLGIRAETLSRALRRLSDLGAISVTRKGIQVTNLDQLRRIAAG